MQTEDRSAKLADINTFVQTTIESGCGCGFTADSVLNTGAVFRCEGSLPSTAVVYRSNVRGVESNDCGMLASLLRMEIAANPVIPVLGNQLDLITKCDTSVPQINSEFSCDEDGSNVAALAGGAAGGVLAILLLVVCVLLLVACGRKRQRRRQQLQKKEEIPLE